MSKQKHTDAPRGVCVFPRPVVAAELSGHGAKRFFGTPVFFPKEKESPCSNVKKSPAWC